jgi:S1-C subfamily serine protease
VSRRRLLLCSCLAALSLLPASADAKKQHASAVDARRSVVTILSGDRQGTAFVFRHPGELLTNAHVVRGARRVDVVLRSGRRVSGEVTELDSTHDLAMVKAAVGLPPLVPAKHRPQVGGHVVAIGSPLGLSGSVSEGVVSAVRHRPGSGQLIQTDVSVNPGNSGGPLLDTRARVLGVTNSRAAAGISFAVPIGYASQLGRHPFKASSGSGGLSLLWVAAAVLLALVLLAAGYALRRRRRERPTPPLEVELRPSTYVPPAPTTSYEPEPQVELKPRAE